MNDDAELLRRYAEGKSEEAFAALVRRHIDFVHAAALRQAWGNAALAQDVTQAVFTDLARKAETLARHEVVVGWLHTATRFAAAKAIRAENRRHAREREAHAMSEVLRETAAPTEWERVQPVLDAVLGELKERERAAILLRFFDKKPLAQVGAELSLSETAARSCVDRALDKMRVQLARRGVTSATTALAVTLGNQVMVAAPAGLATSVTGTALAGTAASAAGWLAIFMSISKLQIGIASALAVAGATGYVVQAETNASFRREIAAMREQPQVVATLRAENQSLAAAAAEVAVLRRDDAELKQLEQQAIEIKQANAESARVAQVRVQNRRKVLEDEFRERDRRAQVEIERMNREGNALVNEYKKLSAQAAALTREARVQADAVVKAKLEEIQRKQREVQDFIKNVRQALSQSPEMIELRSLTPAPGGVEPANPTWSVGGPGKIELSRSAPAGDEPAKEQRMPANNERVSLGLPQADREAVLEVYERIAGIKIIRDPSIAGVTGTVDVQTAPGTREEMKTALTVALRDRFNIILEPAADGRVVAKLGPAR